MTTIKCLADDERFALMKFRHSVQSILQSHHDDHFLLRWLRGNLLYPNYRKTKVYRWLPLVQFFLPMITFLMNLQIYFNIAARKWDPVAAEKMLRDSLEWRKLWEVDKLADWKEPQVIKENLPHGICGYDVDGAPVVVVPFAGLDLYGILHCTPRRDMIKATVKVLERYLSVCQEQAQRCGPAAGQVVVIFDMQDFNLRQYMWRPAGEVVITLIQMYEANYPEILKTCFIINAPKVFTFAFSIAKKFMNDYTISKIQIHKADPPKWKNAILKVVPKDQLPVFFGGTLTDADGNSRLVTKICQGGKIPKELYTKNNDKDKNNEDFTTVVVKKGDKIEIDFPAEKIGSILSWEFKSESHDIKFGVIKKNKGKNTEVIPIHRVAAHQFDEVGVLTCEEPATYCVVFDNSYSLMRNKKIHYNVNITDPTENLHELAINN